MKLIAAYASRLSNGLFFLVKGRTYLYDQGNLWFNMANTVCGTLGVFWSTAVLFEHSNAYLLEVAGLHVSTVSLRESTI